MAKNSTVSLVPKRRRNLRVQIETPLPATISGDRSGVAEIQDLALGGAFLQTVLHLQVDDAIYVKFQFEDRTFRSAAKVRTVLPRGVGVEFVEMKPEDHNLLRDLIARLLES